MQLLYPWQWLTALGGVGLTLRFPLDIDVSRLHADFQDVMRHYVPPVQDGPMHNGRWKRLGLIAPDGDPMQAYARKGQRHRPTPVLEKHMPYLGSVIERIGFPVRSALLSVQEAGSKVRWHRDRSHSIDLSLVRLHIPVQTDPSAVMTIGHEQCHWPAGQMFYADFSFPHRLYNAWNKDRVHVILDVEADSAVRAAFPSAYMAQAARRRAVRAMVARVFDYSERLHPAGRRANEARLQRAMSQQTPVEY
jgi:hypothetical protein